MRRVLTLLTVLAFTVSRTLAVSLVAFVWLFSTAAHADNCRGVSVKFLDNWLPGLGSVADDYLAHNNNGCFHARSEALGPPPVVTPAPQPPLGQAPCPYGVVPPADGPPAYIVIRNMTADRLPFVVRLTNCNAGVNFQNPGSEVGYQCARGVNIDSLNFMALMGEFFCLTPGDSYAVTGSLGHYALIQTGFVDLSQSNAQ